MLGAVMLAHLVEDFRFRLERDEAVGEADRHQNLFHFSAESSRPTHFAKVGEPLRMSTTTSNTLPRQRERALLAPWGS